MKALGLDLAHDKHLVNENTFLFLVSLFPFSFFSLPPHYQHLLSAETLQITCNTVICMLLCPLHSQTSPNKTSWTLRVRFVIPKVCCASTSKGPPGFMGSSTTIQVLECAATTTDSKELANQPPKTKSNPNTLHVWLCPGAVTNCIQSYRDWPNSRQGGWHCREQQPFHP